MSWTTPITWTAGQVVAATDLNQQIRDNELVLKTSVNDDGTLHGCARLLDIAAAELDVTNTNVETSLYTFLIQAGVLSTNRCIRQTVTGLLHTDTTSDTLTLRWKYGGATFATWGGTLLTATTDIPFKVELILSANAATNSQRAVITFQHGTLNTNLGSGGFGLGIVTDQVYINNLAVDSTQSWNLQLTAQWTGTLATDHAKRFVGTTELVYA